MNKQKKLVRKKAEETVKAWYSKNATSLKLPEVLKFSKIKYSADEDEQWSEIDSLLCIDESQELIDKAMKKLAKMKLSVYDIRAYFHFEHSTNKAIRSILYFKFDINGELLIVTIREKEDSPYSEKYYH